MNKKQHHRLTPLQSGWLPSGWPFFRGPCSGRRAPGGGRPEGSGAVSASGGSGLQKDLGGSGRIWPRDGAAVSFISALGVCEKRSSACAQRLPNGERTRSGASHVEGDFLSQVGADQNSRARVTQVLVGAIYQGAILVHVFEPPPCEERLSNRNRRPQIIKLPPRCFYYLGGGGRFIFLTGEGIKKANISGSRGE